MFDIVKRSYLWLIVAVVLMVGSFVVFVLNIRLSTDFTGGINMIVSTSIDGDFDNIFQGHLSDLGYNATVGTNAQRLQSDININLSRVDDQASYEVLEILERFLISEGYIADDNAIIQSSIVGPSVGAYMQNAALRAIVVGILFMVVYMLFSFASVRKVIDPSILSGVTVFTMLFDVLVPAGAYGLLMMINPAVQVDTVFIIAILAIIGYSINDTIIIFDRVRENIEENGTIKGAKSYEAVFEKSIWQTMRRSLGTSISTLLVVIAMYFFGSGIIQLFAFTVGVGIIAGTYSSVFLAVPLAYVLMKK